MTIQNTNIPCLTIKCVPVCSNSTVGVPQPTESRSRWCAGYPQLGARTHMGWLRDVEGRQHQQLALIVFDSQPMTFSNAWL